jgi:hypothetical protein
MTYATGLYSCCAPFWVHQRHGNGHRSCGYVVTMLQLSGVQLLESSTVTGQSNRSHDMLWLLFKFGMHICILTST